MGRTIAAFVKTSQREYIEDLQNGNIFMRRLKYFKECEQQAIGDKFEGANFIFQPNKTEVTLNNPNFGELKVEPKSLTGPIISFPNYLLDNFIFCMTSLDLPIINGNQKIENIKEIFYEKIEKLIKFGDHSLVIFNISEFISRIEYKLKNQKIIGKMKCVEYYDENDFNGQIPEEKLGFMKPRNEFYWQNEVRLQIRLPEYYNDNYKMKIKDLKNISFICETKKLKNIIKLNYEDNSATLSNIG